MMSLKRSFHSARLWLPRKRRKIHQDKRDSIPRESGITKLSSLHSDLIADDEGYQLFYTFVLDYIKSRMTKNGLSSHSVSPDLIFGNSLPSALELCEWLKFLEDPLLIPVDCVARILKLSDSIHKRPSETLPLAVFYVRTFTLTVAQLNKVIDTLMEAKITFKNKIFAWKVTINPLRENVLVHLRYGGVSHSGNAWQRHLDDIKSTKRSPFLHVLNIIHSLYPAVINNCRVQETPHMEISTSTSKQLIDVREQTLICLLERGALNMALGGAISSNSDYPYKDLFQNLRTEFSANAVRMTREISQSSQLEIRLYAHQSAADNHKKILSTIRDIDPTALAELLADQATPRVLKNGRAILLIVGNTPPEKWMRTPVSFWRSNCETSQILQTMVRQFVEWEKLSSESQIPLPDGFPGKEFLPFINLYPFGTTKEEKTESAKSAESTAAFLEMCLQALRPVMVLCLGYEVGNIVAKAFPLNSSSGISLENFKYRVGMSSMQSYSKASEHSSKDQIHYFIQFTSYHPGSLARDSIIQEQMQRILFLTMMKAWHGMSEALKCSEEELDSLQACTKLNKDLEDRLTTITWHVDLRTAQEEIKAFQKGRRKTNNKIVVFKTLRKSETLRINTTSSIKRCDKAKNHTRNDDQKPKNPSNTRLEVSSSTLQHLAFNTSKYMPDKVVENLGTDSDLPPLQVTNPTFGKSYYQGRQVLFNMVYPKDSDAIPAIEKLKRRFPLQRGDLLWLLDQFLLREYPNGGTIDCADPSVWPDAVSVWPQISRFCTTSEFSQHPFAEYLHTCATRASNGTYGAMSVIVSLKVALQTLRTNVVKESYVKSVMIPDEGVQKQRRFTTFVINAICPVGLRQTDKRSNSKDNSEKVASSFPAADEKACVEPIKVASNDGEEPSLGNAVVKRAENPVARQDNLKEKTLQDTQVEKDDYNPRYNTQHLNRNAISPLEEDYRYGSSRLKDDTYSETSSDWEDMMIEMGLYNSDSESDQLIRSGDNDDGEYNDINEPEKQMDDWRRRRLARNWLTT